MFAVIAAMLIAGAQPLPDDCYLTVSTFLADGAPCPVTHTVTMYRLQGKSHILTGRCLNPDGNHTTVILLIPGTYEVNILLPAYGLIDGPKTVEILAGPNQIEWHLPVMIPVSGNVQVDGKPAPTPKQWQAYLQDMHRSGSNAATSQCKDGKFALPHVFPGDYRLLCMSDAAYNFSEFHIPADAKGLTIPPLALTPGSPVSFTVTYDTDERADIPVPYCYIYLSGSVNKVFPLYLTLITDAQGKASTQALPPGTWKYTTYLAKYGPQTGTLTLVAGEKQDVTLDMTKGEPLVPK